MVGGNPVVYTSQLHSVSSNIKMLYVYIRLKMHEYFKNIKNIIPLSGVLPLILFPGEKIMSYL